jgi:hypothetical protein
MYGIPRTDRLAGLLGTDLIQVCIGSHHVILRFDERAAISVECSFDHILKNQETYHYEDLWKQPSTLTTLLGSSVTKVETPERRTLRLYFSNGEAIDLFEDSDQYECFRIQIGEDEIVV